MRLERERRIQPGSRFTYAIGKLVLWSPRDDFVDAEGKVLMANDFAHLAIANPQLAPYGAAAREVLQSLGVWERLAGKLVRGENIGQAFQFVYSGNAAVGFVAGSQLIAHQHAIRGARWAVPADLHAPIEQQAGLLRDSAAGREFDSIVAAFLQEVVAGDGLLYQESAAEMAASGRWVAALRESGFPHHRRKRWRPTPRPAWTRI